MRWHHQSAWVGSAVLMLAASPLAAQYNERPDALGSRSSACDASGRSIKDHRVRAISSRDPSAEGGTAWLFANDPYLAFQLGRDINFREFRERDGVFDAKVSNLLGPMPDGFTKKITANNHTSCSGCHNLPQGNPGGGTNFHKDSGFGRQAPHYYGAGIVEMLAIQIRSQILWQVDRNRDGWVSASEAGLAGASAWIVPKNGAQAIDFGNPRLDGGATGRPQFNNIVRVWFVDATGRVVPSATSVNGTTTHGYNFELVFWGWGQGRGRSALNPTNRAFLWDPFKAHSGLESHDPSTTNDPDGDGVSLPTVAGAIQFPATHKPVDHGLNLDPLGFSRDDPDRDGHMAEITEGDLDLGEWFMLNAPRPGFAGSSEDYEEGLEALQELGCTSCHAAAWTIHARNENPMTGPLYAGDRRFFDLEVSYGGSPRQFRGRIRPLQQRQGQSYVRNFGSFDVPAFFSDLRHHDMGEECEEVDFGGTTNRLWRTPMLWGVGSGFPWMHDGQSLTLHDAIMRHGGEAQQSRANYADAGESGQAIVIDFLEKLRLYDIESMPTDVNGDGAVSPAFVVQGVNTGRERFNAEWLFATPVRIQGDVTNSFGTVVRSFAGMNVADAYGHNLYLRADSDEDGWPDVWDAAPMLRGYKDGVNN